MADASTTSCNKEAESGPVVIRVKRRVTEEPLMTLALHAKKLRLQAAGGAAVFRLAGTLEGSTDPAALQQAVTRAMQQQDANPAQPNRTSGTPDRRRKRYRVLGRVDLPAGEQRAKKRKRAGAKDVGEGAAVGEGSGSDDTKRQKGMQVFDVEFDSVQDSRCSRASEDYLRQLDAITMNGDQLECREAGEGMDQDFVYDLYLANSGPNHFITSDLGAPEAFEEDELDDSGWAFLLDGYAENYSFPHEYRQAPRACEDGDSDPESESNWRNEYPDAVCFEEEDPELWMEAGQRDSDDELGGYADDEDLQQGLKAMELCRSTENSDSDSDEENSEQGPHSLQQMRQIYSELLHERSKLA